MNELLRYHWPGNVRELKNLLEAAFINVYSNHISLSDFPKEFQNRIQQNSELPDKERDKVLSALMATNWNKTRAAKKLNFSRMTLYRKISKHNLEKNPPSKMTA